MPLWVPAGIFTLGFLFYFFCYPYHLFFKEQNQLFLLTADYFFSYFNKPGWIAALSGDFLTQFFILRGGGPLVIAVLLTLEYLVAASFIRKIFHTNHAWLWALLPVAADWSLHMHQLHRLAVSVGFILILLLSKGYLGLKKRGISRSFEFIFPWLGYWTLGSAVFIFPFMVFFSGGENRKSTVIKTLAVTILLLLAPFAFKPIYMLPVSGLFVWPALTWHSLLLFTIGILTFAALFFLKILQWHNSGWNSRVLPLIAAGLLAGGIYLYGDFPFEKILALDTETYFQHPEKVIALSEKYDLANRHAAYYTNMALAQKEILPQRLLEFYQPFSRGLLLPVTQEETWHSILFSNEAFYLVGDMNLAQHSAMLGTTFSPFQRNSRMARRLAEINMVNHDVPGASKYLRMLQHTIFHKKWAEARLKELGSGETPRWLAEKQARIPTRDTIRHAMEYRASLDFLVRSNPANVTALDYLLCYDLLNKDLPSFRKAYEMYSRPLGRPVASVYSEALLISLFSERASQDSLLAYAIPQKKILEFVSYTRLHEETKGDMEALKEQFGTTYWFYYHFASKADG